MSLGTAAPRLFLELMKPMPRWPCPRMRRLPSHVSNKMTSRARGDKPSLEVVSKSSIMLFNTKKGSQIRESNHVENPSAGNGSHFYDVYSHSHLKILHPPILYHWSCSVSFITSGTIYLISQGAILVAWNKHFLKFFDSLVLMRRMAFR
jgi:hypothetical protein